MGYSQVKIRKKKFSRKWNNIAKAVSRRSRLCSRFHCDWIIGDGNGTDMAGTGSVSDKKLKCGWGPQTIIKSNRMILNWVGVQGEVSVICIWKASIWFLSKEWIGGVGFCVWDASGRLLQEMEWRWWCYCLMWWWWRRMEKKQISLRYFEVRRIMM